MILVIYHVAHVQAPTHRNEDIVGVALDSAETVFSTYTVTPEGMAAEDRRSGGAERESVEPACACGPRALLF